mmetsp:Transcript_24097/g.26770  ORF Transcript_24097/g.26770 Transcript_24097/m.26770 type:complete len:273 (+) Transcript_24097:89-907(+)
MDTFLTTKESSCEINKLSSSDNIIQALSETIITCSGQEANPVLSSWKKVSGNSHKIKKIIDNASFHIGPKIKAHKIKFSDSIWNKDHYTSGKTFGLTLKILFTLKNDNYVHIIDYIRFLNGFLRGSLSTEVEEVQYCLNNADILYIDIQNIIHDFLFNFDIDVLAAHVSQLVKDTPGVIQNCPQLTVDFQKVFMRWVGQLLDYKSLFVMAFKAGLNYRERIFNNANAFYYNFESVNFEEAGYQMGTLPHIVFDLCTLPKNDKFNDWKYYVPR